MAEPKEGRTSVPEEIFKLLSHQSWRPLYLRTSCSVIWWSYWLSSVRVLCYWQSNAQFNLYTNCWYTSWSSLACATSKSHSCLARCGLPQSSSWHQPLTNLLTRKGFGLVSFFMFQMWWVYDAKPKIQLLHRDQYVTRSWKSGVGHAGGDGQPEGWVISFVTWHCIVAEEHIENNTAELNWNETRTWQLPGMPSSTSLKMGLVSRLQSGEDYKSMEE